MSDTTLARIETGAVEGRARNLRGRQNQLQSLFAHLVAHKDEFADAIQVEEACSTSEAQIAVAALLLELRKHYDRLDLKKELEEEYRVKHGKSNPERRVAASIAYIIPDPFMLAFSVFTAVFAAIEAGTCVVVEVPSTFQRSAQLVRDTIVQALDNETYAVVGVRAPAAFLAKCVVVDQMQQLSPSIVTIGRIVSSPKSLTLAVVDRTADVKLAARELVASRLGFGGKSPYAIDQVFVNEFVAEIFMDAVAQELPIFEQARAANSKLKAADKPETRLRKQESSLHFGLAGEEIEKNKSRSIWTGQSTVAVEVLNRSSPLLTNKADARLLLIHRVTSLDDAVDARNADQPPLAALYIFAAGSEAKYLSQYIASRATFVNHIPSQLHTGPAFPSGFPVQLDLRYTRDMFENASPEIVPGLRFRPISRSVQQLKGSSGPKLLAAMSKPLQPTGQGESGAWGFFEQAVILGATVYLLPVVVGCAAGLVYSGIVAYNRFTLH